MKHQEKNYVDFLDVLFGGRKLLLLNFLIVGLLAVGVSLVMPRWYTSPSTLLIPSKEGADFGGLSSFLKKIPASGLGLGLEGLSDDASLYTAILKSRTLKEDIINRFSLQKRFKSKNIETALKDLNDYYSVDINEDGTITLKVSAKTRWFAGRKGDDEARVLAKEMAAAFIQKLDDINRGLKIEKARNNRIFLEKRYLTALDDLGNRENEFREFQKKYGTIALPEQTTATLRAAAELRAKMILKDIELGVMGESIGHSNSEYNRMKQERAELQRKYDELNGDPALTDAVRTDAGRDRVFLRLSRVPDLSLTYLRLVREVMLQEKIIELLLPQYEQAKIQEAKDTPTVQVLDSPKVPIRKSKPKRALLVLLAEVICFILSVFYIFYGEYQKEQMNSRSPDYLRLQRMKEEFKSDILIFKNKKR